MGGVEEGRVRGAEVGEGAGERVEVVECEREGGAEEGVRGGWVRVAEEEEALNRAGEEPGGVEEGDGESGMGPPRHAGTGQHDTSAMKPSKPTPTSTYTLKQV